MAPDTGGPAFPLDEIHPENGHHEGRYEVVRQHPGMTLLDWFAGQAITASAASLIEALQRGLPNNDAGPHSIAELAYDLAEAMLAEKRRRESSGD